MSIAYSYLGICLQIQKEMNTFWRWYVQSHAGRLVAVLRVGVLAGFVTTIIHQIIKGIAATNTSNDYFMGKELNAALGFNKALQKFSWDMMKYIRFVTEFKGNSGHWFIPRCGEPAVADSHHAKPGECRHERGAAPQHDTCSVHKQSSQRRQTPSLRYLTCVSERPGTSSSTRFTATQWRRKGGRQRRARPRRMPTRNGSPSLAILASGKTNMKALIDEIKDAKSTETQKAILDKYQAAGRKKNSSSRRQEAENAVNGTQDKLQKKRNDTTPRRTESKLGFVVEICGTSFKMEEKTEGSGQCAKVWNYPSADVDEGKEKK